MMVIYIYVNEATAHLFDSKRGEVRPAPKEELPAFRIKVDQQLLS
jgi:hypothetical protein